MAQNDLRFVGQVAAESLPELVCKVNNHLALIYASLHCLEGRVGGAAIRDHLTVAGRLSLTEDARIDPPASGVAEIHYDGRKVSISPQMAARLYRTTPQNITNAGATTVTFSGAWWDASDGIMWSAAHPTLLRILEPGIYAVGAWVSWDASATGRRTLSLVYSSPTPRNIVGDFGVAAPSGITQQNVATIINVKPATGGIVQLSAPGSIRMDVDQTSGGVLALEEAHLWAFRLFS